MALRARGSHQPVRARDGFSAYLLACREVADSLASWRVPAPDVRFVSLGENCSTAWYLSRLGLKRQSFPFDWVFSSPEIVRRCLEDDFAAYLDPAMVVSHARGPGAGHRVFHERFFNHRSPESPDARAYYLRCVERLRALRASASPVVFVLTLINEPDKRWGWSQGFTGEVPRPGRQSLSTGRELLDSLSETWPACQLLVIDHCTDSARPGIDLLFRDERLLMLGFSAAGASDGVRYLDAEDDLAFSVALAGLCAEGR